jgi:hypothetical protein
VLKERPDVAAAWRLRGVGCFAWGGYSVGVPLLLAEGPGQAAPRLAVVTSAYAAASLAGSGVLSARPVRSRLLRASVLAWGVVGGCFLVMAWGATLPVLAATAAVMGVAVPMGNVTTTQQVAAVTSGEQRVLAMLTQTAVVNGASTAGLMATGALSSAAGARPALALGGIGVLLAAVLTGLSSSRRAARARSRAGDPAGGEVDGRAVGGHASPLEPRGRAGRRVDGFQHRCAGEHVAHLLGVRRDVGRDVQQAIVDQPVGHELGEREVDQAPLDVAGLGPRIGEEHPHGGQAGRGEHLAKYDVRVAVHDSDVRECAGVEQ